MDIAITGHRPEKCVDEIGVRYRFRRGFEEAGFKGTIDSVIYGGAAGCDLWAADEARRMGLSLTLAKPWAGHKSRVADAELYASLEEYCRQVHNVSDSLEFPGKYIYQKRNEWMVDNATHLLAYYDGTEGGTANCWNYADGKVKRRNIYDWPPF